MTQQLSVIGSVDEHDEHDEVPVDVERLTEGEETTRGISWSRVVAFGLLPALAMALAGGAAYLRWQDSSGRDAALARSESVRAATESTIAMLSYQPDNVDQTLNAARNRLTGKLKDSYTSLTHDVVIPGSRQKHITAVATVPAATPIAASVDHAVVLVFVDQTTTVGDDPPTTTASRVRVTLDKTGGHWLVAGFDPI